MIVYESRIIKGQRTYRCDVCDRTVQWYVFQTYCKKRRIHKQRNDPI